MKSSDFWTRVTNLYRSQTSPAVLCRQYSGISTIVSMGPNPHLWFLHVKQRILDQNFQCLWLPALICCFCMQNREVWTRITSLYGSQTSPVLLCMQNSVIFARISSLYGFQPSSVDLSTHNSVISTRINRLYWFQLSCGFVHAKQRL